MAKEEVEEKLKALSKRDEVVKALKDERSDQKATEERIGKEAYELGRENAVTKILNYGMSFKRSTLFMIKEKYLDLDLFDSNLIEIRGYDKFDPTDGSD